MIFNTMEILGHIVVSNYMWNGSERKTEIGNIILQSGTPTHIPSKPDVHLYSNKVDIRPPYAIHPECR